MPRNTSLALAITLALAAAGCTSSVSSRSVSEKTLYQEQILPFQAASKNQNKDEKQSDLLQLLCIPIPYFPWCI
jgi:hypothetical protein